MSPFLMGYVCLIIQSRCVYDWLLFVATEIKCCAWDRACIPDE